MANSNPKQTKAFRYSQGRFARVSKETAMVAPTKVTRSNISKIRTLL